MGIKLMGDMGAETVGVLLPHSSTTSCCHNRLHATTSWSSCTVDVVWLLWCSRFRQIDADRSCSTVGACIAALWRCCGMLLLACCYFCASLPPLAMQFLSYILIFTFFRSDIPTNSLAAARNGNIYAASYSCCKLSTIGVVRGVVWRGVAWHE